MSLAQTHEFIANLAEGVARGNYGDYGLERNWSNSDAGTITVELSALLTTAPYRRVTIIYDDNPSAPKVIDYSVEGWSVLTRTG